MQSSKNDTRDKIEVLLKSSNKDREIKKQKTSIIVNKNSDIKMMVDIVYADREV